MLRGPININKKLLKKHESGEKLLELDGKIEAKLKELDQASAEYESFL